MEKAQRTTTLLRACVMGAMMLALYQPAVAAETGKDVSREISDMQSTIISAEVYSVPLSLSFRHQLSENDVVKMGCTYKTTDMQDVDGLVDVLTHAGLVQRPEDKWARDVRLVIYLHTQEGRRLSLIMTQEFSNAPASGVYNGTIPVVAKMGFGADLRRWKHRRTPSGSSLVCGGD